jgi:TRAP-type C4-dicarboxylate transport system substrate-binding protein
MYKTLITLAALLGLACSAQAANVELKIATAAPGASSWVQAMRDSAAEIKAKTEGRVTIKYYVGGVQGSDEQVLKKMRIRNLHGGAFTPSALGGIYPNINVYGLPLVFDSYDEANYVRERMDQMLIDGLDDKGYVTFGFAATGFAFMMSSDPAATVNDLQGRKVWVPEGDEISYEAMQAISVSPTALPLTDVMVGLQTKLLDMVAVSPTGALFLQWYTRVKYVTDLPLVYTYGFTAIDKKMFERISPADQQIVREVMTRAYAEFNEAGQTDNDEAMQAILGKGLQLIPVDPAEAANIRSKVAAANRKLADRGVVSRDMYELMLQYREEFRNGQSAAAN